MLVLPYSGPLVRNGRAEAVGLSEDGRADGQPAESDARTRHDTVQTLSAVYARGCRRNEMLGSVHVSSAVSEASFDISNGHDHNLPSKSLFKKKKKKVGSRPLFWVGHCFSKVQHKRFTFNLVINYRTRN